jgi:hypothetical protein
LEDDDASPATNPGVVHPPSPVHGVRVYYMYSLRVGACCVAAESAVIHDIIASYERVATAVLDSAFPWVFTSLNGAILVFGVLKHMSMVDCYTN